jgi:hypothetical protein
MIAHQDYDVRDTEGRRAAHVVLPFAIVIFVVGGIRTRPTEAHGMRDR